MFFLCLLIAFSLQSIQLDPKKLILNIRSSEDIWLIYQGRLIKAKPTVVLDAPEDVKNINILVSSVKHLKLKLAEDNKFAATFSNYELRGEFVLLNLEPKLQDDQIEWLVSEEQVSTDNLSNTIIILMDPEHLELITTKTKRNNHNIILPTFHFIHSKKFKKAAQENNLAIIDIRQFHATHKQEKCLIQDALTITLNHS